ncbi:hypothetical protein FRB99_001936 [Tulasnella sp. 403]|nr:hypothetical protein FRB99_001936 [Tulasnella sp. 403]
MTFSVGLIYLPLLTSLLVSALPALPRNPPDDPSGDGQGGGGIPIGLWAPIVVIPVLFIAFMILFRGSFFPKIAALGHAMFTAHGSSAPQPTTSGPRVLTAEQLAGSMAIRDESAVPDATTQGANGQTSGEAGAAASGRRRRRRPRRTPSQISTKSLPPYMAEAGDQELVLVRARHDNLERHSEEEDGQSGEEDGPEDVSSPLLPEPNSTPPPNTQLNEPHHGLTIRPSIDSHMSSNESQNTAHSNTSLLNQERGDAPPYFEVVSESSHQTHEATINPVATSANDPPPAGPPSSFRMPSTLRRLFPWGSSSATASRQPALPVMRERETSQVSLPLTAVTTNASSATSSSNPQSPSSSRPRRPSHSLLPSSPSLASVLSRNRTRARSSSNLASSSTTNLGSISGPLPNSLLRTSFAYPAGGPTPEQITFISSTASLIRFGIPLNEDGSEAPPPPAFDTIVPNARARSTSNVGLGLGEGRTISGGVARPLSSPTSQPPPLLTNHLPAASVNGGNLDNLDELPTPISPANSMAKHDEAPSLAVTAFGQLVRDPSAVPLPSTPVSTTSTRPMVSARQSIASLRSIPEDPHRRVSGSTTNSFATAETNVAHANGGDEDPGNDTETEGHSPSVSHDRERTLVPPPKDTPEGHQHDQAPSQSSLATVVS